MKFKHIAHIVIKNNSPRVSFPTERGEDFQRGIFLEREFSGGQLFYGREGGKEFSGGEGRIFPW